MKVKGGLWRMVSVGMEGEIDVMGEGEYYQSTWSAFIERIQWNTFIQVTYANIKQQTK
jgi:hypothetical protein